MKNLKHFLPEIITMLICMVAVAFIAYHTGYELGASSCIPETIHDTIYSPHKPHIFDYERN